MNITTAQIREAAHAGLNFVGATTITKVKLNKTAKVATGVDEKGNTIFEKIRSPFADVTVFKKSRISAQLGANYENAIRRQAEKDGVEPQPVKPLAWGTLSEDRMFVHHKGEDYLRLIVTRSIEAPVYFLEDGTVVSKEEVAPFIPKPSKSSTQSNLSKEIFVRTYMMGSLKNVKLGGESLDSEIEDHSDLVREAVTA